LLSAKVANLVFTTNFDDFLSRALNLFGKPHIVYDQPGTFEKIDPERDDIQLIHGRRRGRSCQVRCRCMTEITLYADYSAFRTLR
jgi:hypothetical protein